MKNSAQHCCFLAALCFLIAGSGLAQNSPPSAIEAPTTKVGDSWTYDSIDGWKNLKDFSAVVVVKEVTEAGSRTEGKRTDNGQVTATVRNKDLNRLSREVGDRKFIWDPYYPQFSFPLEVGKSWDREFTFTRSYDDFKVVSKLKGQVVGWEKVTVPAGTFEALKIVVNGSYAGSGGPGSSGSGRWNGNQTETIWYSPDVKNLVKSVYEDNNSYRSVSKTILELVEYKLVQ